MYCAKICVSSGHNKMLVSATVDIIWRIKTDLMAISGTRAVTAVTAVTVDVIWKGKN